MITTTEIKPFLEALDAASKVVNENAQVPAYHHVRLTASNSNLQLDATDGDIVLRLDIPGMATQEGVTLAPFTRIHEAIRLASEAGSVAVQIEADRRRVVLRERKNIFSFNTIAAPFPDLDGAQGVDRQVIRADDFRQMIRRTIFASDDVAPRYATKGAMLDYTGNESNWPTVFMVATDGRCLAVQKAIGDDEQGATSVAESRVIPVKALKILKDLNYEKDDKVDVSFVGNIASFKASRYWLQTTMMAGNFPPYRRVFKKLPPIESRVRVGFPAGQLRAAMKSVVSIFTKDSVTKVVTCKLASNLLTISSTTSTKGNSSATVEVVYDGPPQTIHLDPEYVSDALKTFAPTEVIQVDFCGPMMPLVIHTPDFQYLVFPVDPSQL